MNDSRTAPAGGDRLAKVMARSGLCSRRDAEEWIKAGRVVVNGRKVMTPAFNVTDADEVLVDGTPLAARAGTRVWLYHKPRGLVVTEKDPEGRPTIFETLATQGLPRVLSIGRLDINTEGLLLLTNDGGLKRVLELPATGWLRKYRVRAHGTVTQAQLDGIKQGIEIDGVKYGPIEATLERDQGANVWLELALREGKNREVKNVLGALGLEVNRLIRISFGPFQLGELPVGGVETVKARVLKDQLGKRLADEAEVDFDSEMPERAAAGHRARPVVPSADERTFGRGTHTVAIAQQRFRFTDRAELTPAEAEEQRRQKPRPGRPGARDAAARGPAKSTGRDDAAPARHIHFDDGREPTVFEEKTYGKKGKPQSDADRPRARPSRDDTPRTGRTFADKPRTPRSDTERPRGARPSGDRSRPAGASSARPSDAPFRGKPRATGDQPPRSRNTRPATEGDRPARPAFAKSRAPRAEGDRPARSFGDKPARPFSGKPRAPRAAEGDKPARTFGDRPARSFAGKSARPADGKPRAGRPAGAGRPGRPGGSGARPTGAGQRPPRKDGPRGPSRPRSK